MAIIKMVNVTLYISNFNMRAFPTGLHVRPVMKDRIEIPWDVIEQASFRKAHVKTFETPVILRNTIEAEVIDTIVCNDCIKVEVTLSSIYCLKQAQIRELL